MPGDVEAILRSHITDDRGYRVTDRWRYVALEAAIRTSGAGEPA